MATWSLGLPRDEPVVNDEASTSSTVNGGIIPTKEPSFSELYLSPPQFSFSRMGPPPLHPPSPSPLALDSITRTSAITSRGRRGSSSNPNPNPKLSFFRSISNKEPFLPDVSWSPARFSFSGTYPSPPLPTSPGPPPPLTPTVTKLDSFQISHRCISSTLKTDGPLLSMGESNGLVYTGSESNCIRIWKLPDYTESGQLKTKAHMVSALAVSKDHLFAAYADSKIRVWRHCWEGIPTHVRIATIPNIGSYIRNYIAGKDKKTIKHLGPITSLAMNETEDLFYSASMDKTVKVWRISDLKCVQTIQAHPEPINAIVVGDDGVLYTASDDATVRVWRRNFCTGDRQLHSLTVTLPAKYSPVKALCLATDGDGGILHGGCTDGYIHYWRRGWFTGQLQYGGALSGHSHAVMCLANVANYLISGSADLTTRVWRRDRDGQHACLAVLQGHRGPIRCVMASVNRRGALGDDGEDECTVCTGSLDGVLKVWEVRITGNTNWNSKPTAAGCSRLMSLTSGI